MLNETTVTLQGHIGSDVTLRQAGDSPVVNFRVACTPRRFNRRSGEWSDAETQWYTVTAWRTLAEHCADSLHRGDPVMVHGRLIARTYVNKDQVEVTVHDVEALLVGHDLNRGVSRFTKAVRPVSGQAGTEPAPGPESGATALPTPSPEEFAA